MTPQVNRISWAPSLFDAGVEAGHRERGVVLEGYSPFGNTDLDDPVLGEIADRPGVTTGQVVLRWHLDHRVVVIPESADPQRIATNFAISDFSLSEEEVRRIDALAGS